MLIIIHITILWINSKSLFNNDIRTDVRSWRMFKQSSTACQPSGKDGNVDWYFDCVCQVLAMIDRLFESMLLFKSGKSHQSAAWPRIGGYFKGQTYEFNAWHRNEFIHQVRRKNTYPLLMTEYNHYHYWWWHVELDYLQMHQLILIIPGSSIGWRT